MENTGRYIRDIRNITAKRGIYTLDEELQLGELVRQGNQKAMNQLIKANLRIVMSVCKNYRYSGINFDDLIGAGHVGIMRAAKMYDPSNGFKFISYAVWWIRPAVLSEIASNNRTGKITAKTAGDVNRIKKVENKLTQKLNRNPTNKEIGEKIKISETKINKIKMFTETPASLGYSNFSDGDQLSDYLTDGSTASDDYEKQEIRNKMIEIIDELGENERTIIKLYYGIGTGKEYTYAEIGENIGISRERVRQIKMVALGRLKLKRRKDILKEMV